MRLSQTPRTIEEVQKHNKKSNNWIIISNKVYNVTKFLKNENHPGGEVIHTYRGKDATDVFHAYHPKYVAQKKLIKYQVGLISNPVQPSKMVQEYRALAKSMEEKGFYETHWGYWIVKFTYPLLFILFGIYLLLEKFHWSEKILTGKFSEFSVICISAFLISLGKHQGAFVGHDSLHQSITQNWTVDYLIGLTYATGIFGISAVWWKYTHNQHHVVTNEHDIDPDITHLPFFAVNEDMFLKKRTGKPLNALMKWWIRFQHWLFIPVLCIFGRFSMYVQTLILLFSGSGTVPTMPWQQLHLGWVWNTLERISVLFYYSWNFYVMYYLVPRVYLLPFFTILHMVVGFLHVQLTLNHWERPTLHSEEETQDWFTKQVVTGRDVDGNILNEWLLGGLHHQIEHHLYPRMPRDNLSKAKPYVRKFCKKWKIEYCSTGFWHSMYDVIAKLEKVGQNAFDKIE